MRIIKIVVTLFYIQACCLTMKAQHVAVQVGYLFDNTSISSLGIQSSVKDGFKAGLLYDQNIRAGGLHIESGISYLYKGYKLYEAYGNNTGVTFHFDTNNLELPITISKEFSLSVFRPFIKGGLYGLYQFSGKIKEGVASSSMKLDNVSDRINYGAVLGVGCRMGQSIRLDADYNIAFKRNIYRFGNLDIYNRDMRVSLSLAYYVY